MRAYEKTVLTFGIVQIPVALYKASADKGVRLRSLCGCGAAPKMSVNCDCGATYTSWAKVPNRGYEVEKGTYVSFTNEEVKEAKSVEAKGYSGLEAVDFKQVATGFVLESPYYVLPANDAEATLKGYALVRQALLTEGLALVGRFYSRKRQKNVALIASKDKPYIFQYTLTELKEEPFVPEDGNPTENEAKLMGQLIKTLYSEQITLEPVSDPVLEMVEAKLAGEDYAPAKGKTKGPSLEELLKQSVETASK